MNPSKLHLVFGRPSGLGKLLLFIRYEARKQLGFNSSRALLATTFFLMVTLPVLSAFTTNYLLDSPRQPNLAAGVISEGAWGVTTSGFGAGTVAATVFSVLIASREYNSGLLVQTFLLSRRRTEILWAKCTLAMAVGTSVTLVSLVSAHLLTQLILSSGPLAQGILSPEIAGSIVRLSFASGVLQAIATAMALSVPTLLASLLYTSAIFWAAPLVVGITVPSDMVEDAQSFTIVSAVSRFASPSGSDSFKSWWLAVLVIAAYAATACIAGCRAVVRKSVSVLN